MTVQEFKKAYPDKAHLEGNELWDAMEDALIRDYAGVDDSTFQPGDLIEKVGENLYMPVSEKVTYRFIIMDLG